MKEVYLAVLLSVVIGIMQFWGNRLEIKNKERSYKIISFSAGVTITYIFLELLPMVTQVAVSFSNYLFLSVLLGFVIHLFTEREIYKHNHNHKLVRMINLEENIFYFMHHIIIGIVFASFMNKSLVHGLLFFLSIMIYSFVSNLPTAPHRPLAKAIFLASSTLCGSIIGIFLLEVIQIADWIQFAFIGITTGILFFTVTRHQIPFERRGKLRYFSLGAFIYTLLIMVSWTI